MSRYFDIGTMNNKSKILVLMSTYNGERYLNVQIDSILNQEGVDVHLLVRDDGSSDGTLSILKQYSEKYNNIRILEETNCGAIWSFYRLMEYASNNCPDYDYYAFADQDDYWYSNKLVRAVQMNKNNSKVYFYHSCYDIVDAELNLMSKSSNHCKGTLGEALVSNVSIGCSEVFSYKVLERAAKIVDYKLDNKKYWPYHDLWIYLVALTIKADVVFDDYCSLKYRQHGNNVIGTGMSRINTMKFQYRNLKAAKNLKSGFAKILLDLYSIDDDIRELLERAANYRGSLRKKFALVSDKNFYSKDKMRNIAFVYSVLKELY